VQRRRGWRARSCHCCWERLAAWCCWCLFASALGWEAAGLQRAVPLGDPESVSGSGANALLLPQQRPTAQASSARACSKCRAPAIPHGI
jgi:hypothetical protein